MSGVSEVDTVAPLTGGPITGTGTVSLQTPLAIAYGGTSAITADRALDALAEVSGTVVGALSRDASGNWILSPLGAGGPPPLPVTILNGGTGQTTGFLALDALSAAGSQTGTLQRSAGGAWSIAAVGTGTITSVTAGAGLTGGGSSGGVALALATPVSIANGGTGAATAPLALTALGAPSITAMNNADNLRVLKTGDSMSGPLMVNGATSAIGEGLGVQGAIYTQGDVYGAVFRDASDGTYYIDPAANTGTAANLHGPITFTGLGSAYTIGTAGAAGAAGFVLQVSNGNSMYLKHADAVYLMDNADASTFYFNNSNGTLAILKRAPNLIAVTDSGGVQRSIMDYDAGANFTLGSGVAGSTKLMSGANQNLYLQPQGSGTLFSLTNAFKPGGGPWTDSSDARTKESVVDYERGLQAVLALRPVAYRKNGRGGTIKDGRTYVGLVADEVELVMPEMVGTLSEKLDPADKEPVDIKTLDANALTYALVNSIKELTARLAAVEAASNIEPPVRAAAQALVPPDLPPPPAPATPSVPAPPEPPPQPAEPRPRSHHAAARGGR